MAHIDTASTLTMSDHPLNQSDPHIPSSDSASSTVRIKKLDKFRKFWGFSKSKTKEVKLKTSDQSQQSRLSSHQSTRPLSILSQASNLPSGDDQSTPPSASRSGDSQSTPSSTAQEKALSAS